MKKALIIHNPHSGVRKNVLSSLEKCKKIFEKYDFEYNYIQTRYKGHALEIVKYLMDIDLVISVGGDGTFNEIVAGNLKRSNPLVVSHIPVGTANDLRSLFGLGKDIVKNIELILKGVDKQIDVCTINGVPFVYVAGFGKFVNLSYETPRSQKSKFGYLAYLVAGVKDFFKKIHVYQIEYEVDGKRYNGECSLGIVSNANRIAGIKSFYKDVKLDDDTFEVLICSVKSRRELLRGLVDMGLYEIDKVPAVKIIRTNNLKIKFKSRLRKPWTIDGEKLNTKTDTYEIKIVKNVRFRLSEKAAKKNCIK